MSQAPIALTLHEMGAAFELPLHRAETLLQHEDAIIDQAMALLAARMVKRDAMTSPQAAKNFLQCALARKPHEVFGVMFLDAQNCLIAFEEMFRGSLTQTSVYPREIARRALELHAGAVVLAHNHPSGKATPSRSDEMLTQTIKASLQLLDIRVLDHMIVALGESVSMAERGLI